MVGIKSFGAYVPFNRLKRDCFKLAFGTGGKGEKAVANYDEDSLTMAVSAGLEALKNFDKNKIGSVLFATTTSPYDEKGVAPTIATVIDGPGSVRTADVTTSLRCGSQAMLMALDAAATDVNTLVTVADCRLGAANGALETDLGDAAAAFVIGSGDDVVAKVLDSASAALDISDYWRPHGAKFVSSWEDRFGTGQGYEKIVPATIAELLKKTGTSPADYSKLVLYAHKDRHQKSVAARTGFAPEQIQDSLYTVFGNAGSACAPLALVAALENAKPGEKIMMVTYGDGCDAIAFEVTEAIEKLAVPTGINKYIEGKKEDMSYAKYALWKDLMSFEPARRPPNDRACQPLYFRNAKKNLKFYGSKCTECGEVHYPPCRVCSKCGAIDKMEDISLREKTGTILTFNCDFLSTIPDLPEITAVVDFEGGGRTMCNVVDCDLRQLKSGLEVTMVFRKMTTSAGIGIYSWKASIKH